jgi:hypothetical protein
MIRSTLYSASELGFCANHGTLAAASKTKIAKRFVGFFWDSVIGVSRRNTAPASVPTYRAGCRQLRVRRPWTRTIREPSAVTRIRVMAAASSSSETRPLPRARNHRMT